MPSQRLKARVFAICALALLVIQASALSIEKSDPQTTPFKVTHKNSGPTYDIDLLSNEATGSTDDQVEKKKLTGPTDTGSIGAKVDAAGEVEREPAGAKPEQADDDRETIGHLHIRRILLVPVGRPTQSESGEERGGDASYPFGMRPMRLPFWMGPQMMSSESENTGAPFVSQTHRRLFGQDEASRPPTVSGGEREQNYGQERPPMDPLSMMIELMHQALRERLASPPANATTSSAEGDLNREASESNKKDNDSEQDKRDTGLISSPFGRGLNKTKETKEEIVEIEGKKYLAKSVINRHVGEGIVVMTKRLIFEPLNETDSSKSDSPTAAPTEINTKQTNPVARDESSATTTTTVATSEPKEPVDEATSPTTTTTTTTTTTSTVAPAQAREESTPVAESASTTEPNRPLMP